MAEGLHCARGMASSLAVCHNGGPHMATLQVNDSSTMSVPVWLLCGLLEDDCSCWSIIGLGGCELQVVALRRGEWRGFARRGCVVVSGSFDGPSEFAREAALFCGWARRQTVSALRWGGQLWCLPSPPVSFDAGEFAEQSV